VSGGAGHVMQLAAFLVQPHPQATVLHEHILDLHATTAPMRAEAKALWSDAAADRDRDLTRPEVAFFALTAPW
jgi:hypothetical protein